MPKKTIDLPYPVEYLSILDQNGNVDDELDPHIPNEILIKIYHAMLLGRRFDERLLSLQRQGRIGTFAPITGQEASQVGAVAALQPSDWFAPSFRETAAELWRGRTMESVILAFGGFSEGAQSETALNNLPVSIPVASQVLHAVGIGWGMKYRNKNNVVMTFFGDGGTSEGDFHEAMNFASVYQAPVVFVCQNNQWAISIPRKRQTFAKTIAQKAVAYDMPGIQVDGNDVLAVYAAAEEAVKRARKGSGPSLIECVTYRMMMHTTADDPKRYRKDEEVESWKERDPISRFKSYLVEKGIFSEEQMMTLEEEIKQEIQSAVERTEERMKTMGNPLDMFDYAYAEMPNHLKEQRAELEKELAAGKEGQDHA